MWRQHREWKIPAFAAGKHRRTLGDVFNHLNEAFSRKPKRISPLLFIVAAERADGTLQFFSFSFCVGSTFWRESPPARTNRLPPGTQFISERRFCQIERLAPNLHSSKWADCGSTPIKSENLINSHWSSQSRVNILISPLGCSPEQQVLIEFYTCLNSFYDRKYIYTGSAERLDTKGDFSCD